MLKHISDESESYGISVTVSGLLAGFSFTAMIAIIALQEVAVFIDMAFYSFLIATFCFLISTLGGWATLEWVSELKTDDFKKTFFHNGCIWGFLLGLLAFLLGVVATAFLYSTQAGIIASTLSFCTLLFFIKVAQEISNAMKKLAT
ncbi:hypothetical protein A8139_09190 [Marinomonas primoryensis]|uniref:Putative transmembrane protein n=1 Tax=Marinomonas primoryensis TaxID=178399 RepID=A0A2Z4PRR5_9GAMM|nr:hypothetical protein [Marinomonas primoryensis]AWY00150.1 hypothetical protein A8139_09190 [Marinomonas primoryensis]QKK81363.1 putative transmembrane protein [Marinomonas primoryensis]